MIKQRLPIPHPYQQIATTLETEIHQGVWVPGQRLPTVREIADRFGVAQGTAHNAVKALLSLGLVTADSTNGIFIAPATISDPAERLARIRAGGQVLRPGEHTTITSAGMEPAPQFAAGHLGIDPGQPAACRRYVVFDRAGIPVTLGASWFHPDLAALVPELLVAEPIGGGALSAIKAATGRETAGDGLAVLAEARAPSIPERNGLRLFSDTAVLCVTTACSDADGVLEFNESVHPANRRVAVGRPTI